MIDLKTIAVAATIAGALGLSPLGMGPGVANAVPGTPRIDIAQKPHHGDWDDWNGGHGNGRGNGGHGKWGRGGWYPGIDACIGATGPYGNVSGFVCI
jgi:hypothetical protein